MGVVGVGSKAALQIKKSIHRMKKGFRIWHMYNFEMDATGCTDLHAQRKPNALVLAWPRNPAPHPGVQFRRISGLIRGVATTWSSAPVAVTAEGTHVLEREERTGPVFATRRAAECLALDDVSNVRDTKSRVVGRVTTNQSYQSGLGFEQSEGTDRVALCNVHKQTNIMSFF